MNYESGDFGRYYGGQSTKSLGMVGSGIQQALVCAIPDARDVVERTCRQWNGAIRDALRSEMGLRLSNGDQTQVVPVRVIDGMPVSFARAIEGLHGLEWLFLNREVLVALSEGSKFLQEHLEKARGLWGDDVGPADEDDLVRVRYTAVVLLRWLDEQRVLERIAEIEEDVLGAYWFLVPEITIHWVVIGTTARALGLSLPALTVVVLAHELAHAYSHVGFDLDGEQWATDDFAKASPAIKEGLAQFYTAAVCRRLMARMPLAMDAYITLLERQSSPYRAHLDWGVEHPRVGEILRASMLACRVQRLTAAADFEALVERLQTLNHRP